MKYIRLLCCFAFLLVVTVGCGEKQYTVIWDFDYLGTVDTQMIAQGDKLISPTLPARAGYVDGGWWTETNGEVRQWIFEIDTVSTDMTLKHRWIPEVYTVRLQLNDGSEDVMEIPVTYGEGYELPTLQREGFVFEGWYRGGVRIPNSGYWSENDGHTYQAFWSPFGMETTVHMGMWEQDGIEENGKEALEWLILQRSKNGDAYLLVTRYIIEYEPFEAGQSKKSYRDCSLRKWLTDTFPTSALTASEQSAIRVTELTDVRVSDPVFVLSYDEILTYMPDRATKRGDLTERLKQEGYTPDGAINGIPAYDYWLRSSPFGQAYSCTNGVGFSGGQTKLPKGVRPAMWVDAAYVDGLVGK